MATKHHLSQSDFDKGWELLKKRMMESYHTSGISVWNKWKKGDKCIAHFTKKSESSKKKKTVFTKKNIPQIVFD